MDCAAIYNHAIPCSQGHVEARKKFHNINHQEIKIMIVALSAIAWIATIFLGGIGGYATFKSLADLFGEDYDVEWEREEAELRKYPLLSLSDIKKMTAVELMDRHVVFTQLIDENKMTRLAVRRKNDCYRILKQLPEAFKTCTIEDFRAYREKFEKRLEYVQRLQSFHALCVNIFEECTKEVVRKKPGADEKLATVKAVTDRIMEAKELSWQQ